MGIGVYSDDFGGTGGTFMVSWDLPSEAEFIELCQDSDFEGVPEDYENWCVQSQTDNYENLLSELKAICVQLGMSPLGGRDENGALGREFVRIANNLHCAVGVRGWGDDLVVGVAGAGIAMDPWSTEHGNVIETFGLHPDVYKDRAFEISTLVEEYVTYALMEMGYKCRYRTSAWTTAVYSVPEGGLGDKLFEIENKLTAKLQALQEDPADVLSKASVEQRAEITEVLAKGMIDSGALAVPLYDIKHAAITIVDPDASVPYKFLKVPEDVIEAFRNGTKVESDDHQQVFVPRNEELQEAWRKLQSLNSEYFFVSGEEYEAVTDCEICVDIDMDPYDLENTTSPYQLAF